MRIAKTINGEKYHFYIQFLYNQMKVTVRYFQSDKWLVFKLSDDFNYILPEENFIFNNKEIKYFKLDKRTVIEAKDYNPLIIKMKENENTK